MVAATVPRSDNLIIQKMALASYCSIMAKGIMICNKCITGSSKNDVEANFKIEDGRAKPLGRCKVEMEEDHQNIKLLTALCSEMPVYYLDKWKFVT